VGFAALIAAYQDAEDGEAQLRALLPMAGRTLLEHQVRRASAAGASHVVILVERVPASLNAAIDRLRRDGIAVDLAREAADAADRFHPDETVLLVADGLVAAPDCFAAMAAQTAPALLVVVDIAANEAFERVDGERRWAGLALTDRQTLVETAAMLGEWDLQSTLMRKIVQSAPRFVPVDGEGGAVADARDAVLLADRSANSRDAGRAMLARNRHEDESWPARFIFPPIIALAAPPLLDSPVDPFWLRIGAVVLTMVAAIAFWSGWLWSGLAVLLLAGPLGAIAARIDMARLRDHSGSWEMRFGKGAAQGFAILGLGRFFTAQSGESVWLVTAGAAILALVLCARELALYRRTGADLGALAPLVADGDAAIWLLPAFALLGYWMYWPAAAALYGVVSIFLLQNLMREAIRRDA